MPVPASPSRTMRAVHAHELQRHLDHRDQLDQCRGKHVERRLRFRVTERLRRRQRLLAARVDGASSQFGGDWIGGGHHASGLVGREFEHVACVVEPPAIGESGSGDEECPSQQSGRPLDR